MEAREENRDTADRPLSANGFIFAFQLFYWMQLLIDKEKVMKKFTGKGGWTYIDLPEIVLHEKRPFGSMKVRGSIDHVELEKFSLLPMGKGILFMAVNAKVRKNLKKEAGDSVHLKLYLDETPLITPEEILLCLEDEPGAMQHFNRLTESQQKGYLDWIYAARNDEDKVRRIATMIDQMLENYRYPNQKPEK